MLRLPRIIVDGPIRAKRAQESLRAAKNGHALWQVFCGSMEGVAIQTTVGTLEAQFGNESPLLDWYGNQFRQAVTSPYARLMIVGYSFSDRHINKVLRDAHTAGARFFIVDPMGVDAMDKRKVSNDSITHGLWDSLYPGIIGASRRPMSSTFSSDRVEHAKLMHFFEH